MTTTDAVRSFGSDIRILLVGRTGHGKSSTANSILGDSKFKTSHGAKSETCSTQWSGVYWRHGRTIEVVDTPGFFDTDKSDREIYKELVRSLLFTTPGFHAIAFVFEIGRFTKELVKTKDLFFDWFGKGVEKYACIILTRTKKEEDVDDYVKAGNTTKDLDDLIQKCGGRERIAFIDNNAGDEEQRESQVLRIIRMVEKIKIDNNNTYFSNLTFMLANAYANMYRSEGISNETISILRNAKEHVSEKERKMLTDVFDLNNDLQRRFDDDERLQLFEEAKESFLNDYKRRLESGEENEDGFFNFMKKVWSACKETLGCLLM